MLADAGLASATAMVGYARNAIVHDGRLGPGVELITKPFTRDVLLAARVRDILGLQLTGGGCRGHGPQDQAAVQFGHDAAIDDTETRVGGAGAASGSALIWKRHGDGHQDPDCCH